MLYEQPQSIELVRANHFNGFLINYNFPEHMIFFGQDVIGEVSRENHDMVIADCWY